METLSFWARGDSATANNSYINSQNTKKTPTTELTFQAAPGGDLTLEENGGLPDPDTLLIIGGVPQTFTFEFSGRLPETNKFSDIAGEDMRGAKVAVITALDGQRWWFVTQGNSFAVMDDMPNGSIPITDYDETSDVVLCFGAGTSILTPVGERRVEVLRAGDAVLTNDGRPVVVRWAGRMRLSASELAARPWLAPVTVRAHAFGPDRPSRPLTLSPQHRVLISGWLVELHLGLEEVLCPATHLPDGLRAPNPTEGADYVHLLLDRHEVLVSNGLPSESLHPGLAGMTGLSEQARRELLELFPHLAADPSAYGPSCRPSTRRHEGALVA